MDDHPNIEEIRWAPRLKKHLIRRLYQNDARGIYDEELIEEVGYALYHRCRSILTVTEAVGGRVRCPRCERSGTATVIQRERGAEILRCPVCLWRVSWEGYHKTYRHRQLYGGGAVDAFRAYLKAFDLARTPREKLLAIDRVIHEFHYRLKDLMKARHRPAGVNLIEGQAKEVVEFLDGLSGSGSCDPALEGHRREWRMGLESTVWKRAG